MVVLLGIKSAGHEVQNPMFFDTLKVKPKESVDAMRKRAEEKEVNLRYFVDGTVSIGIFK